MGKKVLIVDDERLIVKGKLMFSCTEGGSRLCL